MAKLSAHGTELLRVSKSTDLYPSDPLDTCIWERTTKVYMSDGKVLTKLDVRFKPGPYDNGKPQFHTYGFKLHGKLKDLAEFKAAGKARLIEKYQASGYVVELS